MTTKIPYTKTPNWSDIKMSIGKKYNQRYADSLVLPEQFDFYEITESYNAFRKLADSVIKKYPPTNKSKNLSFLFGTRVMHDQRWWKNDIEALNELAWELFLVCNDKKTLKHALSWVDLAINLNGDRETVFIYMDTKANVLYKMGKHKAGITMEKMALQRAKDNKDPGGRKYDGGFAKSFEKVIEKMKKGEPTW
jgi:hypothetical protein